MTTQPDPTRTVHFRLADALEGWSRMSDKPGRNRASLKTIVEDPRYPDLRGSYVVTVLFAWCWIGVFFMFSLGFIGVPARLIFGVEVGNVVLAALLAASFFCLTGCVNAFWRRYWYLPQARRRLDRDGLDSEGYATSMRRMLPRNSSLVWQSIVGLLTLVAGVA